MNPDELVLPAAYYDGCAYYFERSDRWSSSHFGGPCDVAISGIEHGPKKLHHIATLGCKAMPIGEFGLQMPLLYGMCYDGCALRYRMSSTTKVELVEMQPTSSCEDWPYPDYPVHLPYLPLRIGRTQRCDFREFSEVSCQPDWHFEPSSLIVIVPPSPLLGMSLWGASGDAECTQIVFECDVSRKMVRAFNQCA